MLNIKVVAASLALFFSLSFILCIIYGLITPESIHMYGLLKAALPGFTELTIGSILIGLIDSFLWGAYIGVVYVPIYNYFYKKWSKPAAE